MPQNDICVGGIVMDFDSFGQVSSGTMAFGVDAYEMRLNPFRMVYG